MATLRALPSISTSPVAESGRKLTLYRRSKRVNFLSRIQASSNQVQGLNESNAERQWREQSEVFSRGGVEITQRLKSVESVESASVSLFLGAANGALGSFVKENARELAIGSLVFALVCLPDEHALALGPGGPVFEEFWDNVRRYGFYFFTVVSGGLYSLAKPLLDLMKDPSTQILVAIAVIGTFYLMYLTVSTMLGLNDFVYQYAQ